MQRGYGRPGTRITVTRSAGVEHIAVHRAAQCSNGWMSIRRVSSADMVDALAYTDRAVQRYESGVAAVASA